MAMPWERCCGWRSTTRTEADGALAVGATEEAAVGAPVIGGSGETPGWR